MSCFHQGWGEEYIKSFLSVDQPAFLYKERSSPPPHRQELSVQLQAHTTYCLGTHYSRRAGASKCTQRITLNVFCLSRFLAGRSTPEISSTYEVKGILKPQWPWPSSCEYAADTGEVSENVYPFIWPAVDGETLWAFSFSRLFWVPLVCNLLIELGAWLDSSNTY